ncbi:MAG: SMI1/KNR4 family protein [Lachnospiraceae bacterium]|nr:SMI1/KNR4 family protein [Lachnospiraceae bacterium]
MKIAEIFSQKEDFIAGNGVTKDEVLRAESELGLSFSEEYKEYLMTFGLAMFDGHELTGLGRIERLNVILVTQQMRARFKDIPLDWYVIEDAGIDNIVIWQDSKGKIFFNNQEVYDSFSAYISDM